MQTAAIFLYINNRNFRVKEYSLKPETTMTVIHTYIYRVMAGIHVYTVYIYIVINMTLMASS